MDASELEIDERPSSDTELGRFALRFREAMVGWKPTELAQSVQVDASAIRGYRDGKYKPKRKTLERIAEATGYSVEWLDKGVGEKGEQYSARVNEDRPDYNPKRKAPAVDAKALEQAIIIVEQRTRQVVLPPGKRAKLIALIYMDVAERGRIDDERIGQLIDLVL